MAKIIINEKKYIQDILSSCKKPEDLSIGQLIHLLAKWFYEMETWYDKNYCVIEKPDIIRISKNNKSYIYSSGLKAATEILLFDINDTLKKLNIEKYQSSDYEQFIKKASSNVLRYDLKLKNESSIELLQDELNNIKSCDSDRQKKLLFTCYIYGRYRNCNGKLDDKAIKKIIFDIANIGGSKIEKQNLVRELKEKGFIRQNVINDNISIWVNLGSGDPILKVENFENLGNYILAYLKPNYKQCEWCGKLVKIKGNNQKYCNDCLDISKKANKAKTNNKYYKKIKAT